MNSSGDAVRTFRSELETGIGLPKCQKCGCMADTLKSLAAALPTIGSDEAGECNGLVTEWLKQVKPVQYSCLGCEHCYPAVGQNALAGAFPMLEQLPDLSCEFHVHEAEWPAVKGEYLVLDRLAPVAVSTLASGALSEELAARKPKGLAIVGKTETENIGIDKVVRNIVANPTIQYLIVAGKDPDGHLSGKTLLALAANGLNSDRRVIGSPGKRPILRNVSSAEVEAFREQVQVIDLIGCENQDEIVARVEALSPKEKVPCG
jgi:tetrahydromethanopterin S-methyltransferase subunit A